MVRPAVGAIGGGREDRIADQRGPARPAVSDGFVPRVPPPPAPHVSSLDKIDQLPIQWWLKLEPEKLREYLAHPEKGPLRIKSLSEELTPKELSALPPELLAPIKAVFESFKPGILGRMRKLFWGSNDLDDKIDGLVNLVSASEQANAELEILMKNRIVTLTELKSLLEKGAFVNAKYPADHESYPGLSLAQAALVQGNIDLAKFLLEKGAVFNAEDANYRYPADGQFHPGESLVQAALTRGYIESAKFLLENGAVFNAEDANCRYPADHPYYPGHSLVQVAVAVGRIESAKFLLENGAVFNAEDANYRYPADHESHPGQSLIQAVVSEGKIESAKFLLENGAVFNAEDANYKYPADHRWYFGQSLIQAVVSVGKIESAKFLLENGAVFKAEDANYRYPVDHPDFFGQSLILVAVAMDRIELAKFLLEKGANVHDRYPGYHHRFPGLSLVQAAIASMDERLIRIISPYVQEKDLTPAELRNLKTPLASKCFSLPDEALESVPRLPEGLSAEAMHERSLNPEWIKQFFGPEGSVVEFIDDSRLRHQRSEIVQGLQSFFDKIKMRQAYLGTPREDQPEKLKEYYDNMTFRLQHIFSLLENGEIDVEIKRAALSMIFNGSLYCGTAWFNEIKSAYDLLRSQLSAVKTETNERETIIGNLLYQFRKRCFITALPNNDTHTYNAYMRDLGQGLGVAGKDSSYDDPLSPRVTQQDEQDFKRKMLTFYNPDAILSYFHQAAQDKTQIETGVIPALLGDYGPRMTVDLSNRLNLLQTKRKITGLDADDVNRFAAMEKSAPRDQREKDELARLTALKIRREQRGNLEDAELNEYQDLSALNEQANAYLEMTLDTAGNYLPTKDGIEYLVMALGYLRPRTLRLVKRTPHVEYLIARMRTQRKEAEPGSAREKELQEWLSEV